MTIDYIKKLEEGLITIRDASKQMLADPKNIKSVSISIMVDNTGFMDVSIKKEEMNDELDEYTLFANGKPIVTITDTGDEKL